MSPERQKMKELAACCSQLSAYIAVSPAPEVRAQVQNRAIELARELFLSRELFPVMAKPLAWEIVGGVYFAGNYIYSVVFRQESETWSAELNQDNMSYWLSLGEAKAACEQHHQARFREQCA